MDDWCVHGLVGGGGGAAAQIGGGGAAAQIAPLSGVAAAYAALGISLNALLTAILVPLVAMMWPVG